MKKEIPMNTTHPQEIPSEQYHPGFHLAPDFALPRITVRKRLAIIASQGAGKSYLSMVMVERMVEDGHPVVVIDPLGVYWGLRSSADGTGPGLPILILGGPRGDLPLDATAGRLVADLLVEVRRPVILDLSKFANGRQACLFVADLLTGLRRYEKPKLHVVIDEADQFAPQMPKSPEAQLSYDAMDNLARRDRVKGLGATFITQRPAAIAKDVISQVEALISLRLGGPQDIKALNTWFELHATPEQLAHYKSTVLTLPTGTAWVWSPAWLKVFRQVHVQGRTTFDSSATPDVDEEETRPAHLATINLAELSERMKMLAERTSDNPEQLKARIAQLEAALRQAQSSPRRMSSSGRERQDREPSLPSQVASQQVEQLRSQLTQVTQEKERLVHENLLLREQVAVLGARGTEDASKAQVLVTLPPSLPIAEAIVEHVHLGQHAQDTLLLPPLASADLAAQLEQFQDRLVDQERELEQKNALIHQLRAEIERLQDQQPQGQN